MENAQTKVFTLLKGPCLLHGLQVLMVQRYGTADNVVELIAKLHSLANQVLVVEYHRTARVTQLLALARSIVAVFGQHANRTKHQHPLKSGQHMHCRMLCERN